MALVALQSAADEVTRQDFQFDREPQGLWVGVDGVSGATRLFTGPVRTIDR